MRTVRYQPKRMCSLPGKILKRRSPNTQLVAVCCISRPFQSRNSTCTGLDQAPKPVRNLDLLDFSSGAPIPVEILDLRHFSSADLRPLLQDEIGVWAQLLSWDYSGSAEMI